MYLHMERDTETERLQAAPTIRKCEVFCRISENLYKISKQNGYINVFASTQTKIYRGDFQIL